MWCWIPVSSPQGLYIWVGFSGVALGGFQALFPSALAALTTDPTRQGTRIGMIFSVVSFAVLTGSPIAGALITAMRGRYIGAQAFAGSCFVLGTMFLAVSRECKRKKEGIAMWDKV